MLTNCPIFNIDKLLDAHLLLAKVKVLGVEVHQLRLRCPHGLGTGTRDTVKRHIALTTDVEHLGGGGKGAEGEGEGRWAGCVSDVALWEHVRTCNARCSEMLLADVDSLAVAEP